MGWNRATGRLLIFVGAGLPAMATSAALQGLRPNRRQAGSYRVCVNPGLRDSRNIVGAGLLAMMALAALQALKPNRQQAGSYRFRG